jgi:hypothetical protein
MNPVPALAYYLQLKGRDPEAAAQFRVRHYDAIRYAEEAAHTPGPNPGLVWSEYQRLREVDPVAAEKWHALHAETIADVDRQHAEHLARPPNPALDAIFAALERGEVVSE